MEELSIQVYKGCFTFLSVTRAKDNNVIYRLKKNSAFTQPKPQSYHLTLNYDPNIGLQENDKIYFLNKIE